jgi:DNA replication protein DnaC
MERCPKCDDTGFLVDEETRRAYPCSCRPRRIAKKKSGAVAGRLPKRFRGVAFDREPVLSIARANEHQVRAVRAYVNAIGANLDEGRGIWFTGDVGTGKTTLAMLISKAAMEADRTVAIYSLPRLLAMLRETYQDDAHFSLSELIDRLCAVDLLHIDDVGAEQTTDWVLEQLYTIVNTRYEDGRALLLTTNLVGRDDPEGDGHPAGPLKRQIGERTVSRIWEICGDPLPLFGDDNRMFAADRLPEPEAPATPGWDPFDDSTWEDDPSPYGRPRRGA